MIFCLEESEVQEKESGTTGSDSRLQKPLSGKMVS